MTSSNTVRNIAMVGVGGRVGRYISDELLKTGRLQVTAITREDSTNKIPDGVKVAKVNYDDQASLVKALTGQDVLIITMNVMAPQGTQAKLIDAAAEANVPWILPNEFGSSHLVPAFAKETLIGEPIIAARKHIEEKGKSAWIAIICGFWYEYSLSGGPYFYGFDFENKKVTFFEDGNIKINTSTWAQVGRAVAGLLSLPVESKDGPSLSQFKNDLCHISSFEINQKDMLASILRVTGDSESDWKTTTEELKPRYADALKQMQTGDRMGFVKALYTRYFYPDNDGLKLPLANDTLGLPKEDLDEATKFGLDIAARGGPFAID